MSTNYNAMIAAFRRIPLGQYQDTRKLKRWMNTVYNRARVLSLSGEFPEAKKCNANSKSRTLRKLIRMYRNATKAAGGAA